MHGTRTYIPDADIIIRAVAERGYAIYDFTPLPKGEPITWDEVERREPVQDLSIPGHFIIGPAAKGQNVLQAFSAGIAYVPALRLLPGDVLLDTPEQEPRTVPFEALEAFPQGAMIGMAQAACGAPVAYERLATLFCLRFDLVRRNLFVKEAGVILRTFLRNGWKVLDITDAPDGPISDEWLERRPAALRLRAGHHYLPVPIPQPGQRLADAIEEHLDRTPGFRLEGGDKWWKPGSISYAAHPFVCFRQFMLSVGAVTFTSPGLEQGGGAEPDRVEIPYAQLDLAFSERFLLIPALELGEARLQAPLLREAWGR